MPIILVALVLAYSPTETAPIDAGQFQNLLKATHSALKDVGFLYEGEMEWVGPPGLIKDVGIINERFQGFYAYRADGATFIDVYVHHGDPRRPYQRSLMSFVGGRQESMTSTPDADGSRASIVVRKSPVGNFSGPESPYLHFFYVPYFHSLDDLAAHHYEFQGWDAVDGHQCLRVKLDLGPTARAKKPNKEHTISNIYWLDMARGGHPIRVQHYQGSHLTSEVDGIKLVRYGPPGGEGVWLPMGCQVKQYKWEDQFHKAPVYHINYRVVSSSITVNQKLPDSFFSVKRTLESKAGPLDKTRRVLESMGIKKEFDDHQKSLGPPPSTDRRSVEANLKAKLAEAEKQAQMLEASSAARNPSSWPLISQVFLVSVGVVLCVGAGYIKLRSAR